MVFLDKEDACDNAPRQSSIRLESTRKILKVQPPKSVRGSQYVFNLSHKTNHFRLKCAIILFSKSQPSLELKEVLEICMHSGCRWSTGVEFPLSAMKYSSSHDE